MTEVEKLQQKVAHLESVLEEVLQYLEDRYDIVDGEDGPLPGEEMQLGTLIEEALGRHRYW